MHLGFYHGVSFPDFLWNPILCWLPEGCIPVCVWGGQLQDILKGLKD